MPLEPLTHWKSFRLCRATFTSYNVGVKRAVRMTILFLVALVTLLYVGDWLVLRLRSDPYGSVVIQHYYAIAQKTGRIQLQYDRTYSQQCTRSLLPHASLEPCWYLRRHSEQWTKI